MDFLCWSLYTRAKVVLATGELRSSPLDGVTEDGISSSRLGALSTE